MSDKTVHSHYRFECPLCDSDASGPIREYISKFETDHMQNVHGGPYTAEHDHESERIAAGTDSI